MVELRAKGFANFVAAASVHYHRNFNKELSTPSSLSPASLDSHEIEDHMGYELINSWVAIISYPQSAVATPQETNDKDSGLSFFLSFAGMCGCVLVVQSYRC